MIEIEVIKKLEDALKIKLPIIEDITLDDRGYSVDKNGKIDGIALSNCEITSVAKIIPILTKLKNLNKLNLSHNQIKSILKLKSLKNLTIIHLEYNKISDIEVLLNFSKLKYLNLSYNLIKKFDSISELHSLVFVWLSTMEIEDISFLKGLTNLQYLGLGGNRIKDITLLYEFINLVELNLVHNYINDISSLKSLTRLKHLSLIGNIITVVLPELFYTLKNVQNWEDVFKENPLTSPPIDIFSEGKNAVENYFAQIKKENGKTDYLFEAKLLVIGDGGTGKTTFTRKMLNVNSEIPLDRDTTLGIDVKKWGFEIEFPKIPQLGKVIFNVNLWDFGGQKIYQGTHQIFFSNKSFYVLLTDTREQKNDFSYWLNTVQQLGGEDSSLVIVINKKFGLEQKFDESGYTNHFGNLIKDIIQLDLSCNQNEVIDLQDKVKTYLKQLSGIGDPLPPSWINIRKDLINETQNFISFDRFREICKNNDIKDSGIIRTISGYFNRIGTFTHYIDDELLQERIYLNSNWLVNTVYEVLDNEISKTKKGRLTDVEIKKIWGKNDLHYEINKLTQLMHKFGLMYRIPNSKNYVVPAHLSTATPYKKWPFEDKGITLKFIYEFDKYMPQGIMSRLIVALNHHIKNHELVWHRGINIDLNGAFGEIVEGYGGTNSFDIRIVGENKIELLTVIRERFAEILKPFKNLNYKQMVPCVCSECSKVYDPAFHEYNLLLRFREKGIGSQCQKTGEMVAVERLLKIDKTLKENEITQPKNKAIYSKTIKIFLASSSELKEERDQIEIFINRENKKLIKENIFLELNIWEDFVDHMSRTRLQDEYNNVINKCDIFLSLYFTKVGMYTAEEFDQAFSQFKESGKPYIYTYFKDSQVTTSSIKKNDINSKFEFEEKLKSLGHFPTLFKNIEDLKFHFKNQLEKIIPFILE